MTRRSVSFAFVAALLTSIVTSAQSHALIVTMSVTMSDGRTQELTAPESGLATVTLKDGTEYGFRPTIQDSSPWNRIVVTIFRAPQPTHQRRSSGRSRSGEAAPRWIRRRILPSRCPSQGVSSKLVDRLVAGRG
jgi:hypothetical protein